MIQDIYPHKLNNHFEPGRVPKEQSPVFIFRGNALQVLLEGGEISFPSMKLVQEAALAAGKEIQQDRLQYLFSMDEADCFLLQEELDLPGYEYVGVRELRTRGLGPKWKAFTAITAFQLSEWYRKNRFCGVCGGRMAPDYRERALRCSGCGQVVYPRIVPAVIVGIRNGSKLLLTRYRAGFAHYALVAGFTEIGETLEETVQREVMEETGLRVRNLRYYKSQPWGIVDDLLAGFYCDVEGSDEISMDQEELKEAGWFEREEILLQPDDYSLTNEMMRIFKEGKDPQ